MDIPVASADREARSLNIGSKESTPNKDEEEICSSKATALSEYELEKQRNIQKNAELLRQLDEDYIKKYGNIPLLTPPPKSKKPSKRKEKSVANGERRTSTRLSVTSRQAQSSTVRMLKDELTLLNLSDDSTISGNHVAKASAPANETEALPADDTNVSNNTIQGISSVAPVNDTAASSTVQGAPINDAKNSSTVQGIVSPINDVETTSTVQGATFATPIRDAAAPSNVQGASSVAAANDAVAISTADVTPSVITINDAMATTSTVGDAPPATFIDDAMVSDSAGQDGPLATPVDDTKAAVIGACPSAASPIPSSMLNTDNTVSAEAVSVTSNLSPTPSPIPNADNAGTMDQVASAAPVGPGAESMTSSGTTLDPAPLSDMLMMKGSSDDVEMADGQGHGLQGEYQSFSLSKFY